MNLPDFVAMAVTAIAGALGAVAIFELLERVVPRGSASAQKLHHSQIKAIYPKEMRGPFETRESDLRSLIDVGKELNTRETTHEPGKTKSRQY